MGNDKISNENLTDNNTTHESFEAPGTAISNDKLYSYVKIDYSQEDKQILRKLASEYMDYATLSVQKEKALLWSNLNDLKRTRPMLWATELPWHEMNINDELTLTTSTPFANKIETDLRRFLYLWKHMPADMVLEPVIYSPMIITNSGIGLMISEETKKTDEANNIVGHKFIPIIKGMEDVEKIVDPVVTLEREKTKETYEAYCDIFDGIAPVEIRGVQGFWYAPVDDVVMFMGTGELLENLYDYPELVHASMKRITDAYIVALDQYEALGALGTNCINYRVGSGAYGYSSELGRGSINGMKCKNIWGASASQFFTSVSPDMQDEFSIAYEKEWLERFGLTYYGCCERLDHKMDVLSKISNLRKISCSPWSNAEHMAEVIGKKYVASVKPSPACLAFETFDEEQVRRDVGGKIKAFKDRNIEIIIKDVSTIRYDPYRLFKWIEIVTELCKNAD